MLEDIKTEILARIEKRINNPEPISVETLTHIADVIARFEQNEMLKLQPVKDVGKKEVI